MHIAQQDLNWIEHDSIRILTSRRNVLAGLSVHLKSQCRKSVDCRLDLSRIDQILRSRDLGVERLAELVNATQSLEAVDLSDETLRRNCNRKRHCIGRRMVEVVGAVNRERVCA